MRRNALLTDTLREIRKSRARFLSILCIVGLGVAFFVGIKSSGPDMQKTADEYFDQQAMHDIQILSTMGLTAEDVAEIAKQPYVESVFPSFAVDAQTTVGTTSLVLKVHALKASGSSVRMDEPVLVSGRLPTKAGECAVEQSVLSSLGVKLGDSLRFDDVGDTLLSTSARIVGVVESPLYISVERGTSTLGTGKADAFCYLPLEAFDRSVYTQVNIRLHGTAELNCFSNEYQAVVDHAVELLEEMAVEREEARLEDIQFRARNTILLSQSQLEDAREESDELIYEAKKQLTEALSELALGEEELLEQEAQFKQQMESAMEQIEEGQLQLNEGEKEISKQERTFYNETKPQALLQIEQSKNQLDLAELQYAQSMEAMENLHRRLEESNYDPEFTDEEILEMQDLLSDILESDAVQIPEDMRRLMETLAGLEPELARDLLDQVNWRQLESTLQSTLRQEREILDQAWEQYDIGVKSLQDGERQIREARMQLNEAKSTLEEQRSKLEEARREGEQKIELAKKQLEAGWAQYRTGTAQLYSQDAEAARRFSDAEKDIRHAYDELDRLDEPVWYVLDRGSNYGYADYEQNTQRIAAIGQVFPVLFFLVAALVSLTSMTRMVEEERTQMGTLKALGYDQISVAMKYLLYASIASLVGSAVGMAIGFTFLPAIVYGAYQMLYTLPDVHLQFIWGYAVSAVAVGLLCTAGAAYMVVRRQLKMSPAKLMRPKMPKSGKRVLLERIPFLWSRLGFTEKVTVRNLFRYKKRFFMTVFGIAGCTGLLLAGFGLRNSIMGMVGWQFGDIYKYQLSAVWSEEATNAQRQAIQNTLQHSGRLDTMALAYTTTITMWAEEDNKKDVTLVVAENTTSFLEEVNLQDRRSKEPIPLTEEGLVLTEKMAKMLDVKAGDQVWLNLGELGKDYHLTITSVTEHYVNHYAYLTQEGYEKLMGQSFQANQALCSFTETDEAFEEELSKQLMELDGMGSASFNTGLSGYFDDMMASLDSVVWVIILAAGSLAFIVLYNLANINVTERERELATIKVLGFYDNEVTAYVYRENMVLTLVGTMAGLALGVLLHRYIITTVEVDLVMFGRYIEWTSYVYAAALTFVFSILVNLVMHKKLKGINMIEALKSVE